MNIGRIVRDGPDGAESRCVAVLPDDEYVIDLRAAERRRLERSGAAPSAALRLAAALFPGSMSAAIAAGPHLTERVEAILQAPDEDAMLPFTAVRWAPAIDPPTMLDASAFEQHLVNAHARGKRTVPDPFYEVPVYYKMNPVTVYGHHATVPWPADARYLDYELEFGVIIGSAGANLTPDEAMEHVFGITVVNDFSARDVQAFEMAAGFGPAKSKDFGTAVGPWITTIDDLDVNELTLVARVNGDEWSRGSTSTLTWSVGEIVAYASRDEGVVPGQLIGSGTVGLGCGLELYRKLAPGDVVELEIEGIGTLSNTVGQRSEARWRPSAKERVAQVTMPSRTDR
jgi:2-keto-4-pentenoate hydratase/2-oxohepta-3-ene-1,7-dioic acid hydratase in catechol pathway